MKDVDEECTLPKFNSSPLKGYRNPIGKDRLPTTIFQGRTVKLRGGICQRWVASEKYVEMASKLLHFYQHGVSGRSTGDSARNTEIPLQVVGWFVVSLSSRWEDLLVIHSNRSTDPKWRSIAILFQIFLFLGLDSNSWLILSLISSNRFQSPLPWPWQLFVDHQERSQNVTGRETLPGHPNSVINFGNHKKHHMSKEYVIVSSS